MIKLTWVPSLCTSDEIAAVFDRMEKFFRRGMPFLNSELTINDVSRSLYTNKTYVSIAIRVYTGQNFCAYVNYFRIMYCINMFHRNHELKLAEMAQSAGFRSIATFNISFRKVMRQSAKDWCRKVRQTTAPA